MIQFSTSWPAKELWQNSRAHWAKKAAAVKSARFEARWEAWINGAYSIRGHSRYAVEVTFAPAAKSRADRHNLPATVKAHIDGIADALLTDDRCFEVSFLFGEKHGPTGEVMFSVAPIARDDANG